MKRGDTSLWILTKMAMLFFITALAGLLLVFGSISREGLCKSQASTLSQTISTAITQMLNSPLEDERRVLALPTSLALGEGIYSRYHITISRLATAAGKPNAIIISASSEADPACEGGVQLTYDKSWDGPPKRLFLTGLASRITRPPNPFIERMDLKPAAYEYAERSRFISLVKCSTKDVSKTQYLFIQDCVHEDANDCLGLTSGEGSPNPGSLCSFG